MPRKRNSRTSSGADELMSLPFLELCRWFVDTTLKALSGCRGTNSCLKAFVRREPEKTREILTEIYRPRYFGAQKIVDTYCRVAKGRKVKELRDTILHRRF